MPWILIGAVIVLDRTMEHAVVPGKNTTTGEGTFCNNCEGDNQSLSKESQCRMALGPSGLEGQKGIRGYIWVLHQGCEDDTSCGATSGIF